MNPKDYSYVNIGYELRPYRQYGLKFDPTKDLNIILMMTVQEYLQRRLTYDTDILNAFSGVLHQVGHDLGSSVVMGSISRFLDWSILFVIDEHETQRRDEFPSWTWCGWKGTPQWAGDNDGILEWTSYGTWIL